MKFKTGSMLPVLFLLFVLNASLASAQNALASPANKDSSVTRGGVVIPPEKAKPITVPRFEKPPTIDGNLDDAVWQQAVVFKDFIQIGPGDNVAPSRQTEAMIGYDAKTFYMAFRCFDERDKVRATLAKRDQVFGEDNVRVFLDTFNDQRRAYVLGFNPLGIQQDGIMTDGQGTDFNVDVVMESKGVLTDFGWTLEVAVPFKSLRYEAGKGKLWGIHIWRNIDRFNDEVDSWMPISRHISGTLNQAGHITGLENISAERTLEIVPSMTLKESGERLDTGRFLNPPMKADAGVTIKYTITPNVTLDAAINPDFADVEADAPVVAANRRFPIFFDEKRPFFLEGVDIFKTPIQAVHTRTIIDPDIAAKLSGKIGRNTFGLMVASDRRQSPRSSDPNANVGVLRLKRDIGKESNIGFLATSYNFNFENNESTGKNSSKRFNQLAGIDGRFKVDPKTIFSFQVLGTTSRRCFFEPGFDPQENPSQENRNIELCGDSLIKYRIGNGFAYNVVYDYTGRLFGWQVGSQGRTKDYRADVGFTRRTNNMNHFGGVRFSSEPKPKATVIEKTLRLFAGINNDFQGRIQNWFNEANLNIRLQRNIYINGGMNYGYEKLYEDEFGKKRTVNRNGKFFGPPERRTYNGGFWGGMDWFVSKKITFFTYTGPQWNEFDFDFGGGPKFPRVSPAALRLGQDARQDPGPGRSYFIEAGADLKPTDKWNVRLNYNKNHLRRKDTGSVAFDSNIFSLRSTYQFTRFTFIRARVDYDTLQATVKGQYLFGWTPNPGTALYVGYNDDFNYRGFNRFTDLREQGFNLYGRTFFIKMSYLIRKSF